MKPLLLFIALFLCSVNSISAQTLEHFEIKKSEWGCRLCPKFDNGPVSGVNGMVRDPEKLLIKLFKALVLTFPEDIQEELKQQKVWVEFYFNAEGKIFYLQFYIREKNKEPFFLTDEQWLKIYRIIQAQKLDISKFELLDDFEWGVGGFCPISKYLQEAEQNK